jgi:galactokinase
MAQAVENDYIGSPCGKLDQIMILFAREGMGTHYRPSARSVDYVPLGAGAADFRIVGLDTGTVRPGLEKSTYKVRRAQCEEAAAVARGAGLAVSCLADIRDGETFEKVIALLEREKPELCGRVAYIYKAQKRFHDMLAAWKGGDVERIGAIFREDGIGLRDEYRISGPELETMCDIARTVPGVLGERMLGGGDKGASGALVRADAVDALRRAVDTGYPRSHPAFADRYAVHVCKVVDGVRVFEGAL